jgi:hypothetical protein
MHTVIGDTVTRTYLTPGTWVRLDGGLPEHPSEFGVVVHCWLDEYGRYDCYIAFFGDECPAGKPDELPYVLTYASTSLVVLDREDFGAQK